MQSPTYTRSGYLDIWHEVPLVAQLTGMSCWAAAAAMLIGWRDCIYTEPQAIARGAGDWQAYRNGLEPGSIAALASCWGLYPLDNQILQPQWFASVLRNRGPLWLGEASPGLHSVVIVGMYGDLSPWGTYVRVNDPWPIGRGERYSKPFALLVQQVDAASHSVGRHIQILHCGGRCRERVNVSSKLPGYPSDRARGTSLPWA